MTIKKNTKKVKASEVKDETKRKTSRFSATKKTIEPQSKITAAYVDKALKKDKMLRKIEQYVDDNREETAKKMTDKKNNETKFVQKWDNKIIMNSNSATLNEKNNNIDILYSMLEQQTKKTAPKKDAEWTNKLVVCLVLIIFIIVICVFFLKYKTTIVL